MQSADTVHGSLARDVSSRGQPVSNGQMSARDRFFEELQRAIARGFTLAAVSLTMSCESHVLPRRDAGEDGGSQVAQSPRDADGGALSQLPTGSLFCMGDAGDTGPYYGSCCTNVHCYQPTDGTCAATVAPHDGVPLEPSLPPGSGTCLCGAAIAGPFAQTDGGTTECCYVAGSIGCTGRPLRDRNEAIIAAVVVRSDWA